VDALSQEITNKQYMLNVEYKVGGVDYATLQYSTGTDDSGVKEDVAQYLITEGYVLVEGRKEKRLSKLVSQYKKAEEKAKEARVSEGEGVCGEKERDRVRKRGW